jgi:hypothetical protein
LGLKLLHSFDANPGSGIRDGKISDPGWKTTLLSLGVSNLNTECNAGLTGAATILAPSLTVIMWPAILQLSGESGACSVAELDPHGSAFL